MGIYLKPINPTKDAPTSPVYISFSVEHPNPKGLVLGYFNWLHWMRLKNQLAFWGIDTSELEKITDDYKDIKPIISAETCQNIASAIELNLNELCTADQKLIEPTIELWRTCGGYELFMPIAAD